MLKEGDVEEEKGGRVVGRRLRPQRPRKTREVAIPRKAGHFLPWRLRCDRRCGMSSVPLDTPFLVAALYRFAPLDGLVDLRASLLDLCRERSIRGTLLLASEGINGTVAGSDDAIAALVEKIESIEGLAGLDVKYSRASEMPFHRMKVRLKKEIVTMGVPDVDPRRIVGTYVEPADWNELISDPETIVIDTRNEYEVAIGTFRGAVDPHTRSFREFPDWIENHRDELEGHKVAMFCTGGIRCEKATAYVKSLGIENVFHLRGGILKYLEEVPPEESLWQGECFVFDERVAVAHGLAEGEAELCRACGRPVTPAERLSERFVEGISCAQCFDEYTDEDRLRFAERQRQFELAAARGNDSRADSA